MSLRIPKRKITIFTGVSGSGKSSIVFDTIATEAQRQLYENFSLFIRNFLPRYPQPDADAIENLSMAVIVDQKRLGGGSHSTVGTITDIYTAAAPAVLARRPAARRATRTCSRSTIRRACAPSATASAGSSASIADDFLDMSKSLNEGAVQVPVLRGVGERHATRRRGFFDNDKKLAKFTQEEMDLLLYGKARKFKMRVRRRHDERDVHGHHREVHARVHQARPQDAVRAHAEGGRAVPHDGGRARCARARGSARPRSSCKIDGHNIAELSAMEIGELIRVVREIDDPVAAPIVATLVERLQHVVDIGLDYLSLNRETDTLSGGESQRVKMVKHLGSSLVDVMYIFDEPSVGLHPRDVHRLNELLQKLRDKGNTVLVVEHDPDVIKVADHIVDVGPARRQRAAARSSSRAATPSCCRPTR